VNERRSKLTEEPRGTVLIVEDEPLVRRLVDRMLTLAKLRTHVAASLAEGLAELRQRGDEIDIVLTDLGLEDGSGMDVLAATKLEAPEAVVVVMTAMGTISNAVEAMRAGAYDFLVKPFEPPETLIRVVDRALERKRLIERNRYLESQVAQVQKTHGLLGESQPMRRMLALIEAVAPTDSTVLIQGESGSGKELVARAVHSRSARADKVFIAINCGALAESVLESELFGHARGAFTGAVNARKGLFEEASGGTLFLDEVGEMPLSLQVRLLRVLEQREVRPVGSNETRKVDVRVIAATNRNLVAATQAGTFREDLFYRLNVVSIDVPSLRERASDIPLLVHHFIALHAKQLKKTVDHIDPEALQILCAHTWPGNIRELQNAIERSVVLARPEGITIDVLPPALTNSPASDRTMRRPYTLNLADALAAFERTYIEHTLREAKGNIAEAARAANVDRSNFRRLLKRHTIEIAGFVDKPSSSEKPSSGEKPPSGGSR
jgi:DNA-binding NtrC family response regulator